MENLDNINQEISKLAVHDGKKYVCYLCNKLYHWPGTLTEHILGVHEKGKDHACEFCGKGFFKAQVLINHVKIVHEGKKDYKCEFCDKRFGQIGHLNTHISKICKKANGAQINPRDYQFDNENLVKKEVKEEVIDEATIKEEPM